MVGNISFWMTIKYMAPKTPITARIAEPTIQLSHPNTEDTDFHINHCCRDHWLACCDLGMQNSSKEGRRQPILNVGCAV
jgi:hypothetical protein